MKITFLPSQELKNSLFQANLKADRAAVAAWLTPLISHPLCHLQQWKQCHIVIYRLYQGFPRGLMDRVADSRVLESRALIETSHIQTSPTSNA